MCFLATVLQVIAVLAAATVTSVVPEETTRTDPEVLKIIEDYFKNGNKLN